jgi:hypothetical protein
MAVTINSSTTSGAIITSDNTGITAIQANNVTSLTADGTGRLVLPSISLPTATAGDLGYNGTALYFTPAGTQRGVIPGMQYYRLDSALVGSNVSTAQSIYGVGVTLSSSTIYQFEYFYSLVKTAGTTSHTVSFGFGGSATLNSIAIESINQYNTANYTTGSPALFYSTTASQTVWTSAMTTAAMTVAMIGKGTVSINAGGTFIPQYQLSAAPGGAYSTAINSYMLIYPVGAAGSNTSIGTWA